MTARDVPEDGQPNVPPDPYLERMRDLDAHLRAMPPVCNATITFAGGPVDTSTFIDSHGRSTPTTLRNVKRSRPAETYPGEAERMIDTWTKLVTTAIAKARDATSGPRLVSALEEAEHAIQEALRWSKP